MKLSTLRLVSLATATCGFIAGSAFIGYWVHCTGQFPWSMRFHNSFLGPYALVAMAALFGRSRRSAAISFVSSLIILGLGVCTYLSLVDSGIYSINDITNVTLPIQAYLAWMALAVAAVSFIIAPRKPHTAR